MQKKHGVAHTTSVFETDCPPFHCHPTLPKDVCQCMPIHGLCAMQKSKHANMAPLHQRTKGCRRNYVPPIMWSINFGYLFMASKIV